ncbi:MAG: hypothetical protein LBT60_02275, partial [Oscillospiraceae bacterium]|nr:hypothetical protein [Oscillospiraceae bacterium]
MKTLKNKKVLSSVFAILVCLALITGATMAWFTAGGGSNPTDYVAGTLGYDLVLNDGISEYLDTDALYPYVDYEFTTPDWQPGDVIGSSKAAWIDNAIAGLETYIGGTSYYQWLVERWVRFDRTLHPTDPFTDGNVVNIDFNIATGNEDLLNLLYGVKSTGAYWSYLDDGSYPGNAILDPVTGYLQNDYFDYGTLKNTGNL